MDRDGLTPREPLVLAVKAVDDAPPAIMASRESMDEVVLDSEVVSFDAEATDDFGVKRWGWSGWDRSWERMGRTRCMGRRYRRRAGRRCGR